MLARAVLPVVVLFVLSMAALPCESRKTKNSPRKLGYKNMDTGKGRGEGQSYTGTTLASTKQQVNSEVLSQAKQGTNKNAKKEAMDISGAKELESISSHRKRNSRKRKPRNAKNTPLKTNVVDRRSKTSHSKKHGDDDFDDSDFSGFHVDYKGPYTHPPRNN